MFNNAKQVDNLYNLEADLWCHPSKVDWKMPGYAFSRIPELAVFFHVLVAIHHACKQLIDAVDSYDCAVARIKYLKDYDNV